MALYETTFITRQDLSRQDVAGLTDELSQIIISNGGNVVKKEYWGLRSLAYMIKKNRKGHYTMLGIDASNNAMDELKHSMRINENIIRNMILRVDEISQEPSSMMNQQNDYDNDDRSETRSRTRTPEATDEGSNTSTTPKTDDKEDA